MLAASFVDLGDYGFGVVEMTTVVDLAAGMRVAGDPVASQGTDLAVSDLLRVVPA